ncbi:unnamed protein product [Symbiodinium sp. KB8]|nr:unnamed protein product [Symbiodinium sp. KB8]
MGSEIEMGVAKADSGILGLTGLLHHLLHQLLPCHVGVAFGESYLLLPCLRLPGLQYVHAGVSRALVHRRAEDRRALGLAVLLCALACLGPPYAGYPTHFLPGLRERRCTAHDTSQNKRKA